MYNPKRFDLKGIPNLVYAYREDDTNRHGRPYFVEGGLVEFPSSRRTLLFNDKQGELTTNENDDGDAIPARPRYGKKEIKRGTDDYAFDVIFPHMFIFVTRGIVVESLKKFDHRQAYHHRFEAYLCGSYSTKETSFYKEGLGLRVSPLILPNVGRDWEEPMCLGIEFSSGPFNEGVAQIVDQVFGSYWNTDMAMLEELYNFGDEAETLINWEKESKKSQRNGLKYAKENIVSHEDDSSLQDLIRQRMLYVLKDLSEVSLGR